MELGICFLLETEPYQSLVRCAELPPTASLLLRNGRRGWCPGLS